MVSFSSNWSARQVEILRQYGLKTEEGWHSIRVEEEKLNKDIFQFLKEWGIYVIGRGVEFDKKEILIYNI